MEPTVMLGGYVIFWRAAMDSPIFDDDWLWRLFCWCVFKANFEDGRFLQQVVKRGQFVTGKITAADELMVSQSKWFRGMEKLVEYGAITKEANHKWTTVTVCNYETYQDPALEKRTSSGPVAKPKWTTSGTSKKKSIKEERNKGRTTASAVCPEPASQDSEPPPLRMFPDFPTAKVDPRTSEPIYWTLTPAKLAEYRATYPAVDIEAEFRKAWQWLADNASRRKTALGMPAYLGRWLSKCIDRGGASPLPRQGQYASAVSGIDPSILPKD